MGSLADLGRSIGADVTSLVLPLGCAGCGRWDVPICPRCRALWAGRLHRCEEDTVYLAPQQQPRRPGLPVWALAPYRGIPRRMVLDWKNHTRADLRPLFTAVARRIGAMLAGELIHVAAVRGGAPVLVLPAPSGWRRRLRRQLVVADLARFVARGLTEVGNIPGRVSMTDLLRTPDASLHRLGASARRTARRVRLARGADEEHLRAVVVLVDDVVTTGSTLAACTEVLRTHGATVAGAVVLAATPRPGSATWQ